MIDDKFENGASPYWVRFAVGHSEIEHEPGILRFVIDGAEAGKLSDAEIDDHRTVPRGKLPWVPPLRMTVRARMSHPAGQLRGTAGFGFWNDPFDWVGNVQVPPNALWFFYGSPESDMSFVRNVPGHGWRAAVLNGGQADKATMAIGNMIFRTPGLSRLVFRLAETRIRAGETLLHATELTNWHSYRIDWLEHEACFFVNDMEVLREKHPPRGPLGFVAWLDNNFAVMGPGREFAFGRLAVPTRQWLELAHVRIENLGTSRRP